MKDPAIFSLALEGIDTINEKNALDPPNLIPPDHVSDDKSMIDDDETCHGDDFQIPVPSILEHGNYVSHYEDFDTEDSDYDVFQ